jgi:predicted nuclease of restriction endonuclease-like (RecB) superfamily
MGKDLKNTPLNDPPLLLEIRALIEGSRQQVAQAVNSAISLLYWEIGRRIKNDILNNQRAEYGMFIMTTLSEQLSQQYGKGWSKRQLHHCLRFSEIFPDPNIVHTLCTQLSWSHIRLIVPLESKLQREFYIEMCKIEKWSVRTLQERINSLLFERTAISKKPEQTIQNELRQLKNERQLTPDLIFRDPYFLDFLGLSDTYSERNLESAILVELQKFIIELGTDFAFMARQKRITIDQDD